jgi:phosphate acetyltransferase
MKIDLIKIIEKKAKEKSVKVVVCEGWDERVLRATGEILKKGFCEIILLDNGEIKANADKFKVDISKAKLIDFKSSSLKEELVSKLVEVRKHKGLTKEDAEKLILDENYFGCVYAYCGYADAVASSVICPTAGILKPALQILREKGKVVSEVCIFSDPKNDRVMFGTDFSMNMDPNVEELAQITVNAAKCVKMFGVQPKIALLSFSTKGSGGKNPEIDKVVEAAEIAQKEDPDSIIDAEYQVDAAVNPEAAKSKCPDSILKGDANTLVFPNLTASNIFAHGIGQFSNMTLDVTIMQGLIKPIGVLGRSTSMDTVRNIIVGCAMQVNSK